MLLPDFAVPGQLLGTQSSYNCGPGTHLVGPNIYASLPGRPRTFSPKTGKPTLTIPRLSSASETADLGPVSERVSNSNTLPQVGSTVVGRVTRCSAKQVNIGILVVIGQEGDLGQVCADEIPAVVRREDVRATEKDKVVIGEAFRAGDLVRAIVVSNVMGFPYVSC